MMSPFNLSKFICHNPDCTGYLAYVAVMVDEHKEDEMAHRRTRCVLCDHEFNEWINVPQEMLQKVFGENWQLYI